MENEDMEALTQITKEIEKYGYIIMSVVGAKQYIKSPSIIDITLKFSRIQPDPNGSNALYVKG